MTKPYPHMLGPSNEDLPLGLVYEPGYFDTPENYRSFIAAMLKHPPSQQRNEVIKRARDNLRRNLALQKAGKI